MQLAMTQLESIRDPQKLWRHVIFVVSHLHSSLSRHLAFVCLKMCLSGPYQPAQCLRTVRIHKLHVSGIPSQPANLGELQLHFPPYVSPTLPQNATSRVPEMQFERNEHTAPWDIVGI